MRTIVREREGKKYHLKEDGTIEAPGSWVRGGVWRFIEAVQYSCGEIVKRYGLEDLLHAPDEIPWKDKRGRQQVFIRYTLYGEEGQWWDPHHVH